MTDDAEQVSLGAAIIGLLVDHGVDTFFGIPGTHNLELYRGLAQAGDRARHVLVRHEQAAGYAADAYARAAGRPGCVIVTSGPGLANVLVGAGNAYADRVPMLVLSPGPDRDAAGTEDGWLHYTKDQHGMAQAVFERSVRAETPEGALTAIEDFVVRWRTGESSLPLHLEVPADLLSASTARRAPQRAAAASAPRISAVAPASEVERLRAVLDGTSSVGVVVGREARAASSAIGAFARSRGALVVETGEAKGVVPLGVPGYLGATAEFPEAAQAVFGCDVVLVLGSELRRADVAVPPADAGRFVIRVGRSHGERFSNLVPDVALDVDPADLLTRLSTDRTGGATGGATVDTALAATAAAIRARVSEAAPAYVRRTIEVLQEVVADGPLIVGDSSQVCYFGVAPLLDGLPAGSYLNSFGFSTLGYCVPAAVGAALAAPRRPVLGVTGDGALLFSIADVHTAVEQRLPIVVLVVDNSGYGEIRDEMVAAGIAPVGVEFGIPDLGSVIRGLGADYVRVVPGELDGVPARIRDGWRAHGPTIIHVTSDVLEGAR
jgi:acetolactate synthase-1/2/3 large subunit